MTDPIPADIVAYNAELNRFKRNRPLQLDGTVDRDDWLGFMLWRISEQLERLADYSMVDTMDEPPAEPWRDNGEDDE